MEHVKVGIDFGTSQTKICSRNIEKGQYFTFHKFSKNKKYVLPSTIILNSNGKCDFGKNEGSPIRYFKMKSLFADNYHPEICCILYLCYCILDIKKSFNIEVKAVPEKNEQSSSESGILSTLSRFFKGTISDSGKQENPKGVATKKTPEYTFHYTIGIPTRYDWSRQEHKRRGLQYEMLYLALELSNSYLNLSSFLDDNVETYRNKIKTAYNQLILIPSKELYKVYLNKNIYVIAETTAGIFFLQNQFERALLALENNPKAQDRFVKNNLGNYITMDVGAGTTDISFFKLRFNDSKVKLVYYASQTINCASNYIIINYLKRINNTDSITEDQVANFNFQIDQTIWNEVLVSTRSLLSKMIKREILPDLLYRFNKSFQHNWQFDEHSSTAKGCKVYGGGSRLNAFSKGQLILNDQGNPGLNHKVTTTTELSNLIINEEYLANIELRNADGKPLSKKDKSEILPNLHLLNTSLGLSLVDLVNRPDNEQITRNHEVDDDVNPQNIDPIKNGPDDFEGMARFDIFNRDWI
jgi:hypothetical protein